MVHFINLGDNEQSRFIQVEEVQNTVLNELHYVVTWDDADKTSFIVAFNVDKNSLEIQGAAPYEAREMENDLLGAIANHANGFPWL